MTLTSRTPDRLTASDELAVAFKQDETLYPVLWESVHPAVYHMIRRYARAIEHNAAVDAADIEQVAAVALLRAARSWQPDAGARFFTWFWTILHEDIVRALRLGDNRPDLYPAISMDQPIDSAGEVTVADIYIDRTVRPMDDTVIDEASESAIAQEVHRAISQLMPQQQRVINEVYFTPDGTMTSAAAELGVSLQRASVIHADALARLKRDKSLREIYGLDPLSCKVSAAEFNRTRVSAVEKVVFDRMRRGL